MKRIIVLHNQSIWDIAVQEYGSYDAVKQLMIDNPGVCDFENSIPAGTELFIKADPVDKSLVDYFSANKIKPCTAVDHAYVSSVWILAGGTWNDNGFWVDNALWID